MKSAIVIPPSPFLTNELVFPPNGALCIKRYVEEHSDHVVDVLDSNDAKDLSKYPVVGFSCTTPQYEWAKRVAMNLPPTVVRVVGGPHAKHYNLRDKRTWEHIIYGDGCASFLDILNRREPSRLPDSVDQKPHRDASLHRYKYLIDGLPATVIMTSRGCPNACRFCEDAGTPVRLKRPVTVWEEIRECVNIGFGAIMFFDDLFCINQRRVESLCAVIRPLNIKFRCFAHARNFTPEMAAVLRGAGCVEIGFGAESMSQDVLDNIDKRTTVAQNYELVKIAHEHGIRVKAFTMLGLPGDSEESARDLEKFVLKSGIDDFDVSVFYPYRDTYLTKHASEFGIEVNDAGKDGYYKSRGGVSEYAVSLRGFPKERIEYWQKRILKHKREGTK